LTVLLPLRVTGTIYLKKFGFEITFFMGMMCSKEKEKEKEEEIRIPYFFLNAAAT
jgi:hypothetical protein